MSTTNHQLQRMLEPAQERLKRYTIEELCRKGNIEYDEASKEFLFPSMGKILRITYPDFCIEGEIDMWRYLTALQYMDTADGSPLAGKWIGLSQMRGGLSRGRGFDRDITAMVEANFADLSAEDVKNACLQLGGHIVSGKADVSAVIPYASMFPVLFTFWEGDDEFPPSAKLLVDEFAEHYLTIEAAGGACTAVVREIQSLIGC